MKRVILITLTSAALMVCAQDATHITKKKKQKATTPPPVVEEAKAPVPDPPPSWTVDLIKSWSMIDLVNGISDTEAMMLENVHDDPLGSVRILIRLHEKRRPALEEALQRGETNYRLWGESARPYYEKQKALMEQLNHVMSLYSQAQKDWEDYRAKHKQS